MSEPADAAKVGRLHVNADPTLPPVAPPGFRTCHGDMDPPITKSEAAERRKRRKRAAVPALAAREIAALRTLGAKRTGKELWVSFPSAKLRLPLGNWADDVFTQHDADSGKSLRGQVDFDREWDSFYSSLLAELVPNEALFAFAGADRRHSSSFAGLNVRFLALDHPPDAVIAALAEAAPEPLSALACAQEEHGFHRNHWRVLREKSRLKLTAKLDYGDYGGLASVDIHAVPVGSDAVVLVTCLYEGSFHEKGCAAIAAGATVQPALPVPTAGSR